MTARPVHLANPSSYTGNECRTPWDSQAFTVPDPLTRELEEVTCKACRAWMVKEGRCPECGERRLVWAAGPVNRSGVVDGRLTMHDVVSEFYLGCEECSETLISSVHPDEVARALTDRGWRP